MITIYHVANARSTRSVWLAYELGLDFEIVEMKFTMAALRAPEYLSVSPLGRVPALRDGDLTIFESGAICQYLCETYDDGKLHRPPGHPERAEWLQWVHYAETIAVHSAALVQQQVFIAPDKRSEVVIKLESKRLEKALEVLDQNLASRDYVLRSGFSAADTSVGYSVHLASTLIETDKLHNVTAYHRRLARRDAFNKAIETA